MPASESTESFARQPQEDLPQVLVTPFELVRILGGHSMTVRIHGTSQEVCVRIPTADELEQQIREAQASLPGDGPGMPSRRQIERMVRPVSLG